jgi:hypothetical protein
MVTTFDILVKMAGVPTAPKAPSTPMGVNAPNATGTPAPVAQPSIPPIATNLKPPKPSNILKPISPGTTKPSQEELPSKIALDAHSAMLGLGGGLGGFALGKAFLEPSMQSAAKASPWILGALTALVVGSLAAKSARKDENEKVHLEHALSNLSPAERQIMLDQGDQSDLRDIGFHSGPSMHPSDSMASRKFF